MINKRNTPSIIDDFLLKHIPKHPKDIASFAANELSINRMTAHRHLKKLITQNKIVQSGHTKGISYFLQSTHNKKLIFHIKDKAREFNIFSKYFEPQFKILPKNIFDICEYGFTEMLNNAFEHSEGKKIEVKTHWSHNTISIIIQDNGVGIFNKIQEVFRFKDKREVILALSKGKLTTDPQNHTGEGIFFSSRAFDLFRIVANGFRYIRNNLENDWIIENDDKNKLSGTTIKMQIEKNSPRDLIKIFKNYQDPEELSFDRTDVLVKFSKFKEEHFISRSQAKRILFNLDKFKKVTLDFQGVESVGQGFVDEIFRVFKNKRPNIKINYTNTNVNVEFMIKRGIATAENT